MVQMLEASLPWTKQRIVALAMPSAERVAVLTATAKLYLAPLAAPTRVLAALKPRVLKVSTWCSGHVSPSTPVC